MPPAIDHAVKFAVVDFNPAEKFIKEYDTVKEVAVSQAEVNNPADNALIINSITKNWDALFKDLPANDFFLMNSVDSVSYSKTGGIFVPLPDDWWVMSTVFLIEGKPYCYVVKLEIKKRSVISCRPDKSNLVPLADIYRDEILKKP